MADLASGGCLCGAFRFECDPQQFIAQAVCHCRDCQYVSGGSPAPIVALPEQGFERLKGETKTHSVKAASGNTVTRHFCPDCGTPMFSEISAAPGLKIIKVGTLDDPSQFTPQMSVWTSSSQPWSLVHANIPKFEKDPT